MTILSATLPAVRPRIAVPRYATWQAAMRDAVRDADELCRLLDLPAEAARAASWRRGQFPLFVPRGYVARMRPGDPNDPLLRQVLPLADEMRVTCRDSSPIRWTMRRRRGSRGCCRSIMAACC